nr:hypothetical protein FEE99_09660 [Pseudomonas sp. ef1]
MKATAKTASRRMPKPVPSLRETLMSPRKFDATAIFSLKRPDAKRQAQKLISGNHSHRPDIRGVVIQGVIRDAPAVPEMQMPMLLKRRKETRREHRQTNPSRRKQSVCTLDLSFQQRCLEGCY